MNHLPILPILIPLLVGACLLLLQRRRLRLRRGASLLSVLAQLGAAAVLLVQADSGVVQVYLVGNWPAHLGIALAVDRLSALMLLTTALLALPCLIFAFAGWDRRAPYFHALFQLQLAGLNGAFLTADLFNLFVFFEVLLIASYGLLLSGGRGVRLRAGLHYVAFNIAASTLFLIAVGLLYGMTGALNMGELATRIAQAPVENVGLIRAAGLLLLVVFCGKAALLPLFLWLPQTYARAPAPVAALFAVMTKLGIYAVLRVYTVMFGADAGALADLAWNWLLLFGALTLALASFGVLAATTLRVLAAYLVIGSAATLFIAVALAQADTIGAGLYYLVHSTLAAGALFLLADLIRRRRATGDSLVTRGPLPQRALFGGVYVVLAVALIGLPPLSGFVAKLALLAGVPEASTPWVYSLVLISSLLMLIAMAQGGSRLFWGGTEAPATPLPRLSRRELLPTLGLVGATALLALLAAPALRYTRAAAEQLLAPGAYVSALHDAAAAAGRP